MDYFEILTIIITIFLGAISAVYTTVIKNTTRKNSEESEKLLFELKQVNDDVNDKIREAIETHNKGNAKPQNNKPQNKKQKSFFTNKNDEKLEQLIYNHHTQALSQSKIQFWFSLIAAVGGFIFIIVMVYNASASVWYDYVVRVLPGVIIEAVSVLFFSQSRETRERSSDFLNRLREDRQYEKGIAIAESISDEELKSTLKAEIALRLCGINDINIFENRSDDSDDE